MVLIFRLFFGVFPTILGGIINSVVDNHSRENKSNYYCYDVIEFLTRFIHIYAKNCLPIIIFSE